jgi:hypothetical protein
MDMSRLTVSLRPISEKLTNGAETGFRADIINKGDEPIAFNLTLAANPSLVFEIQDAEGKTIGLPPPSPPTEDELKDMRDLAPGESFTIDYRGALDLFQPSGHYRVRFFSECYLFGGSIEAPVASDWFEFEVVCPPYPFPEKRKKLPIVVEKPWIFWEWKWLRDIYCWIRRIFGIENCDQQFTQEVDVTRTEVMSDAPSGFEAWNGTYSWHARFRAEVDQNDCSVTIVVLLQTSNASATLSTAQRTAWETALQNSWSNIFKLCCTGCCCKSGYTISLDVQFVNANAHHIVNVQNTTTNMTNWGNTDTTAINHEMGHMLGAKDEYYTVDGTAWGSPFQSGAGIMNNPSEAPLARHFDLVRDTVQTMLGSTCTTKATGESC